MLFLQNTLDFLQQEENLQIITNLINTMFFNDKSGKNIATIIMNCKETSSGRNALIITLILYVWKDKYNAENETTLMNKILMNEALMHELKKFFPTLAANKSTQY